MTNKMINPYGIKTPKTVEEFRENLKRYYVTISHGIDYNDYPDIRDVPIDHQYLYVREKEIPLSKISSFDDIYRMTESGWYGSGVSPYIIPLISLKIDVEKYMSETNQWFSPDGYFMDESNFKVWDNQNKFLTEGSPSWYSLDNQWLREFYMMTLGEYCEYVFEHNDNE
jgi:hypothetical protein